MQLDDGEKTYLIPKGSSIMCNIQAVHLNPAIWPNPMCFDPDRFIGQTPAPYTFLPFIAGPRNCLGQYLALLESKMVISLIGLRYTLSLPDGEKVSVENWEGSHDPRHRYMVPVIPREELIVHVKRK
jgi:cytochrome P450